MNPQLRNWAAIATYVVVALLVVGGYAVSPLVNRPSPPTPSKPENSGAATFTESFNVGKTSETFTSLISLETSTDTIVETKTPVRMSVAVVYNYGGSGLSDYIRLTSVTLVFDSATILSPSADSGGDRLSLNLGLTKSGDWVAAANVTLEYSWGGTWSGQVVSKGVSETGASVTLRSQISIPGLKVVGPEPFSAVLFSWSGSTVLWSIATAAFLIWARDAVRAPRKPSGTRA